MSEDLFEKKAVASVASEEPAGRTATPLPQAPDIVQGAPAPAAPPGRRERFQRWLYVFLAGMMVLATVIGVLVSILTRPASTTPPSAFRSSSCPFKLDANVVEGKDIVCGYLTVPADHNRPQGPTIRLAVAIIKASYPVPTADPVVDLEGGPGGSTLVGFGPVLTSATLSNWKLGDRDLVLLDQRGVGYSQPSLTCQDNETLQACHNRLVQQGINLDDYNTVQNAEDVHALVRALGYHQVTLWSISYGTRLALTVMRLFPSDIRSVVLDSTAPPQLNLDAGFPAATQRAFDRLFQGCAASSYCNQHYPHLEAVFARLVSELNQHPATVQVTDPQTGKLVRGVITGNDVIDGVRNALYETALIPKLPKVIYQLAHHDYTEAAAVAEATTASQGSVSLGMFYSVECSDVTFLTPQAMPAAVQMVEPETRDYFLTSLQSNYATCQLWHVQPEPAAQRQPVTSAIPTLILAGEYDPTTPPAYGRLAAQTLSRSYFFLFPGTGHGVIGRVSCANSMFLAFLEDPNRAPDSTCMAGVGEPLFE